MTRRLVELVLRRDGCEIDRVRTHVDPDSADQLRRHVEAALRRHRLNPRAADKYVLDAHEPGTHRPSFSFTTDNRKGGRR